MSVADCAIFYHLSDIDKGAVDLEDYTMNLLEMKLLVAIVSTNLDILQTETDIISNIPRELINRVFVHPESRYYMKENSYDYKTVFGY